MFNCTTQLKNRRNSGVLKRLSSLDIKVVVALATEFIGVAPRCLAAKASGTAILRLVLHFAARALSHAPGLRLSALLPLHVLAACAGLAMAAYPAATQAQSTDRGELSKTLQSKQSALQETESRANTLQKDLELIRGQRERLNKQLIDTGALIRKSEVQLTEIEGRIGELEAQKRLLKGSLERRHASISKLLAALQRMGRNPPPVMITGRKDALKMVRSAMMIAAVFPEMRGQALTLAGRLKELVGVMNNIKAEGARLRAESERLSTMRVRLSGLLEEKKQKITDRQEELQTVRKAAREISDSVNNLNELIAKLDTVVKTNSSMANYEAKLGTKADSDSANTVLGQPGPAPPSTINPSASGGEEVAALRPSMRPQPPPIAELGPEEDTGSRSLVPGPTDRIEPVIPFAKTRGKLPLPAVGKRILSYGEKTQYGGSSKGIVLETRPFGQVISPADGWIVYAGKFRSYGKLLIINAGGGYHILLAGLSRIDVEPGRFVLAAEPVGAMRGTPRPGQGNAQTVAHNSAPVLYVEFRKAGNPINPDPWWANSRLKVQG